MHKLALLHELQKQQLIGCQMSVAMATTKIRNSPNLDSFYNISMLKYMYISSIGTSKGEQVEVLLLHMIYNYVYSFSKWFEKTAAISTLEHTIISNRGVFIKFSFCEI